MGTLPRTGQEYESLMERLHIAWETSLAMCMAGRSLTGRNVAQRGRNHASYIH